NTLPPGTELSKSGPCPLRKRKHRTAFLFLLLQSQYKQDSLACRVSPVELQFKEAFCVFPLSDVDTSDWSLEHALQRPGTRSSARTSIATASPSSRLVACPSMKSSLNRF